MARIAMDKDEGSGVFGHGTRPWVYFMVDAFFLVTEFFVITFRVKNQDWVLPHKLPPGNSRGVKDYPILVIKENNLAVHARYEKGVAIYSCMQRDVTLDQLDTVLANVTAVDRDNLIVRVSYEGDVPWRDVISVFNSCARYEIKKCGLIPLRASRAAPPAIIR
jgi:biopolymer transport protein ExbD